MKVEAEPIRRGLDWPEKTSLVFVALAMVTLLIFGGFLSAVAFLICAVMGWTRAFRDNEAKGKPTLSNVGRAMVGTVVAAFGIALFPHGAFGSSNDQPDGASSRQAEARELTAEGEPSLSSSDAWESCRSPILRQLTHPSTADFSMFDTHIRQAGPTTVFSIGLTAKNGFGLELRLLGYCEIEGGAVKGAYVVERTD